MVTSSAVVGSSAMRMVAAAAAIAIMARWRMPPDSSKGHEVDLFAGAGMPTLASSRMTRWRASFSDIGSWNVTASAICRPMVYTGEKAVIGSWKIMAMSRPRIWRNSSLLAW